MEENRDSVEELVRLFRISRRLPQKSGAYSRCHPGAFFMLMTIRNFCERKPEAPGVSVGELAGFAEVSMPAVSRMARKLESQKLIERISLKENRRIVYVRLTEGGQKLLEEAEEQESRRIERMARYLGEEDTKHLIRIMKKLFEWEKDSREENECGRC